jgi:integrative and conjugative element protein (TIGR02256 family)
MQNKALDVVWYSDGTRKLKIPQRVLDELCVYGRSEGQKESGGILLGLVFKDYDEILELGPPSRSDKAGLFSFIRRRKPAQQKIDRAWNISGGYVIYLGEWHTHPRSDPTASEQDMRMIENALQKTLMEIDYLYLVIAGSNSSVWIGRQDRKGLKMLEPEEKRNIVRQRATMIKL